MKWENPKLDMKHFEEENIVTVSSMTVQGASDYVDHEGATGNFLTDWLMQL